MWKKFSLESLQLKKFTLSQQIVILITLVVCIALLPASMFTTYKVSKVIYDRVSINAVSINNILCNSEEIQNGLETQNYHVEAAVDRMMANYVNQVDHSDEAGVAIYDKHGRQRVMYNPGNLPNFAESARDLMEKYAQLNTISWQENYAIPNKAFGFVKNVHNETIGYVVTGYSDDIINKSTIDSVLFLLLTNFLGLTIGILGVLKEFSLAMSLKR